MLRITAFGAFGEVLNNPSIDLAKALDRNATVLEVAYEAVDEWIQSLDPNDPTPILSLGVAAGRKRLSYEVLAHNRAGSTPDVRDVIKAGQGTVKSLDGGMPVLGSTFLSPGFLPFFGRKVPGAKLSFDPGTYLCNYLHYRQLQRLPNARVGFVHVVPFETVSIDEQLAQIERIIRLHNSNVTENSRRID